GGGLLGGGGAVLAVARRASAAGQATRRGGPLRAHSGRSGSGRVACAAGVARARAHLGCRYGGLLPAHPVWTPQALAIHQPVKDLGGRRRRAARDPELRYHLRSIGAAIG